MIANREPALILGAIQAIITLIVAFGLELSVAQLAAIDVAATAIASVLIRSKVTPVSSE